MRAHCWAARTVRAPCVPPPPAAPSWHGAVPAALAEVRAILPPHALALHCAGEMVSRGLGGATGGATGSESPGEAPSGGAVLRLPPFSPPAAPPGPEYTEERHPVGAPRGTAAAPKPQPHGVGEEGRAGEEAGWCEHGLVVVLLRMPREPSREPVREPAPGGGRDARRRAAPGGAQGAEASALVAAVAGAARGCCRGRGPSQHGLDYASIVDACVDPGRPRPRW